MTERLTAISLFTGAGGLDLGLEAAGIETAVAVESDSVAARTISANRPAWRLIDKPIGEVAARSLMRSAGLRKRQVDLVVGGPPCQPFSKSGLWARGDVGRLADPRSETLGQFMRVVEEVQPRAFLLENVPGFSHGGARSGLTFIETACVAINRKSRSDYQLSVAVLNAASFGAPQLRERLFVVGLRDGASFSFPEPQFGVDCSEPYRTAWDALGDLPADGLADEKLAITGKWSGLVPTIPEGENYLFHTERGRGLPLFGWRTRYWSFLLKLAKSRPAWTITAQPGSACGPFHWKNRRLSCGELLRLQTFPDNYEILGSRGDVQRQIGNAVPCLLGEVIGRQLVKTLCPGRRYHRPLKYLPPVRTPVPRAERRRPIPSCYKRLVGRHADHPGTGLGPGAVARAASSA